MTIDSHTSLYGVIGNPLGHSLSPIMHNAAFSATCLNAVYLAFETEDVEGCLRGMRALHIKGMSVTIPHKSAVIPYLDEVDPLAKMIGAVNTIVNENGRLVGYNTDARGAAQALEEKVDLAGRNCLILGAGGAARAIGFMLREKGVTLAVANRSERRGKNLASVLESPFYPLNRLDEARPDLLIQTTSVGMYPRIDRSPAPEHILKPGMAVMDIIYNPVETELLRMARARGCVTIGGLSMFMRQGAEQFRLWTGMTPPVSVMTDAVEEALSRQA